MTEQQLIASGAPDAVAYPKLAFSSSSRETRRVLAILYQFPPLRAVGARSCAQICRYLPAYGWDVTVLTVQKRYISDVEREISNPFEGAVIRTGLIPHPLDLYQRFRTNNSVSKGELRPPIVSSDAPQRGGLRRLVPLLHIPDPYTGWIPPAVISGLAAIRRKKIECLFSSGPWWTNHLVALILARLTGLPWVAHFRDSWAQGHWVKPTTPLSIRIEKALERSVVRRARAVVCVTAMQSAMLRDANPDVPRSKFMTIPNGYDDAEWIDGPVATIPSDQKFVITYAGNLYHGRSPYPLFRALHSLIESKQIAREQIRVELLGVCDVADGSKVSDVAAAHGLSDCVSIPGVLEKSEAIRRMQRSNLLLLLVHEQNYSIPAKTSEYLSAGRPILALTTRGAVVDLLRQTGGAWIVNPADTDGIKQAVTEAFSAWKRGVDARLPDLDVVKSYDRRLLTRRFAEVLDSVIAAKG